MERQKHRESTYSVPGYKHLTITNSLNPPNNPGRSFYCHLHFMMKN